MDYDDDSFRAYAALIVRSGAVPGRDRKLQVRCEPAAYPFARLIAEAAYQAGCAYVTIRVQDAFLGRWRALYADPESFDYFPPGQAADYRSLVEEGWATVSIGAAQEDLDALEGIDPAALGRFQKASSSALAPFRQAMLADRFPWIVVDLPTPKWARRLGLADEAALWEILKPILRLDAPDPLSAWTAHAESLEARASALSGRRFSALRFSGPGTELRIGLLPGSLWTGGRASLPDGRRFLPNLPTEEVFTSPDRLTAEGRVEVRKPVEVLGTLVEGAWLRFERGRAVECGAKKGADSLREFLAIDEGSSRLGEVALVDETGAIARSGLLFGSGLLDENASCHLALGAGFPGCLEGMGAASPEALAAAGLNQSLVHVDFMVGASDVAVFGIDSGGSETPLLSGGRFARGF